MIVSYSVENFKSIKNKMEIWFTPGNSRTKTNHISEDGCLKSTAIFGANASGKSSLIRGLKFLKKIITDPYYSSRDPIYHWDSESNITKFEIVFNVPNESRDYTTYRYAIDIKTIGARKDKITEQSFIYKVSKEELHIISENDVDKIIFLKEVVKQNNKKGRLLVEINELKNKLQKMMKKQDSIVKLICSIQTEIQKINESITASSLKVSDIEDEVKASVSDITDIQKNELKEELNNSKNDLKKYISNKEELCLKCTSAEEEKKCINKNIENIIKTIEQKRFEFVENIDLFSVDFPTISTGAIKSVEKNPDLSNNDVRKHIDIVRKWFVSTLVILETDDFYLPLNNFNVMEDISKILRSFDVGICNLKWKKSDYTNDNNHSDNDTIRLIKNQISENDRKKLDDCEKNSIYSSSLSSVVIKIGSELNLFTYWKGEETIEKLVVYRDYNKKSITDVNVESDGTRRIIELAAILLPADNEKIFVIDEIERRLHPSLTKKLIELFYKDKNGNKQLIFSTHETLLMTRELFRSDEIQFMYMSDDGTNTPIIEGLDAEISGNPDMLKKNLKKLYLDDKVLRGIPRIPN